MLSNSTNEYWGLDLKDAQGIQGKCFDPVFGQVFEWKNDKNIFFSFSNWYSNGKPISLTLTKRFVTIEWILFNYI